MFMKKNSLFVFIIILLTILLIIFSIVYFNKNKHHVRSIDTIKYKHFLRTKIWENVLRVYGLSIAESIFPKTYILPKDTNSFIKDETSNKEYIVKTLYSGERAGVFLYEPQMKHNLDKYAVIQEYIKNPLLINGYKFDTRIFMVIDCNKGIYLYKKGYNVYTYDPFDYKSNKRSQKINQTYTNDDHYVNNKLPKTTDDLLLHNVPYDKVIYDVAIKLRYIINATPQITCSNINKIYGLDVEILDNFSTKIIEINADPSLDFKDSLWKEKLIQGLYDEMNSYESNSWIQLVNSSHLTKTPIVKI